MRLRRRTIAPMTGSRDASFCLWLTLVVPSSFVVHKYLGWPGVIAYPIVVALIVTLGQRLSTQPAKRDALWLHPRRRQRR